MADAPHTEEGWFALHDFRTVDWDAWRDAPERDREAALEEVEHFLVHREALAQSDEGDSATFSITGNDADLLFVHFRPTLDDVDRIQRRFEQTAFAEYTERAYSYVSVTEISGYTSPEYFEDPESVDTGLRNYMEGKLTPEIPEDTYVSFYPMSKRRDPEYNWYDLPMDERRELMKGHGEVGKQYAGKIKQVIASSVGLDDWEWGVTLFADDLTDIKDIVYEMRFDPASSKYGEFGEFYVGRRFPPHDLGAYMNGETVPTGEEPDDSGDAHAHEGGHDHGHDESDHGSGHGHGEGGHHDHGGHTASDSESESVRRELEAEGVYGGQPHGEDVYALVLYSDAEPDELAEEVYGLRESFDHYDTHVKTALYEPVAGETDHTAVVSIWDTQSAADTASGFLSDLPDIVRQAGDPEDGWGTMGMFYTVKPEYRGDFLDTFDDVGDALADMDGHRDTTLLANREDENDMFIASNWDAREHAMDFFRSDAFSETVKWGRDVLADRPRHVFLA